MKHIVDYFIFESLEEIKEISDWYKEQSKKRSFKIKGTLFDVPYNYKKNEYPSESLSKKLKLPEIYTKWKMPKNIIEDDIFSFLLYYSFSKKTNENLPHITNKIKKLLDFLYREIIKLNKSLYKIDTSKDNARYHIVFGAISRFCLEDIRFYIEDSEYFRHDTNYDQRKEKIKSMYPKENIWFLSIDTLNKIESKSNI